MSGMRLRQLITLSAVEPELQQWLRDSLEKYKAGVQLDKALGISGELAVANRNHAIRLAAGLIDKHGDMSTWGKARLLAQYLDRSLSARGNEALKEVLRTIGKQSKYGQGLRSVRRIYDVLKVREQPDLLDLLPPPGAATDDKDES